MSQALRTRSPALPARDTRRFEVLRLSVTPQCNLHCAYCRPRGQEDSGRVAPVSVDRLLHRVRRLMRVMPMREIHITGGEPTLHRGLGEIVRGCRELGIPSIALTTNGTSSPTVFAELASSGLSRVNVSLDAVGPTAFAHMSGVSAGRRADGLLDRIKANIELVRTLSLPVKLNMTVLRGRNDSEILPVLEWAMRRRISVRFLELMRMGPVRDTHSELFVSMNEILQAIGSRYSFVPVLREPGSTARLFETPDRYRFGVIANHSQPFCQDCNRLRMDADGRIFGCISSERGFPLTGDGMRDAGISAGTATEGISDEILEGILQDALREKRGRFEGSSLSMQRIGG